MLEANLEWSHMSLYDYERYNPVHCPLTSAPDPHRPRQDPCSDMEDFTRIKDRGWAVRRQMVPKHELDAMMRHVESIQEPARSMCGASGFQPRDCFVGHDQYESLFPSFFRSLKHLLGSWISSGFHVIHDANDTTPTEPTERG